MYLSAIPAGFMTGLGLIMAIGAQNAFALRQGLQQRYVALVVVAFSLSDIVLIMAGVAGTGKLVQAWPAALQVLRFGGAAFLAAYGLMAARRALKGGTSFARQKKRLRAGKKCC
ncbi:LysE/ArgO family amino acid transporter [Pantoea alhagi]|uniref:LysE/ArgO family amino acid transporter n=1 Tax=Pantoea alhagi TaxID=1891675 RepID=UPI001ABF4A61|nr:LysE family transporter [Pantoea alhagi]